MIIAWNRDDDPNAWTWKHRGHVVIVDPDPFAVDSFDTATFELRVEWSGVRDIYYWDRRATYVLATQHPDRMRAWLRLQGGYAADGEAPSTVYRDFAENVIAAIRVDHVDDIALLPAASINDLRNTPAARRVFLVTAPSLALIEYTPIQP